MESNQTFLDATRTTVPCNTGETLPSQIDPVALRRMAAKLLARASAVDGLLPFIVTLNGELSREAKLVWRTQRPSNSEAEAIFSEPYVIGASDSVNVSDMIGLQSMTASDGNHEGYSLVEKEEVDRHPGYFRVTVFADGENDRICLATGVFYGDTLHDALFTALENAWDPRLTSAGCTPSYEWQRWDQYLIGHWARKFSGRTGEPSCRFVFDTVKQSIIALHIKQSSRCWFVATEAEMAEFSAIVVNTISVPDFDLEHASCEVSDFLPAWAEN